MLFYLHLQLNLAGLEDIRIPTMIGNGVMAAFGVTQIGVESQG